MISNFLIFQLSNEYRYQYNFWYWWDFSDICKGNGMDLFENIGIGIGICIGINLRLGIGIWYGYLYDFGVSYRYGFRVSVSVSVSVSVWIFIRVSVSASVSGCWRYCHTRSYFWISAVLEIMQSSKLDHKVAWLCNRNHQPTQPLE